MECYSPGLAYVSGAMVNSTDTVTAHIGATPSRGAYVHTTITPPTGFDHNHTNVTAAVLKVTYTGDLDDRSGTIEIGVAIHDETNMGNVVTIQPSDIKKTYFYQRCSISKGVRAVYLPINGRMLENNGET